MKNNDGGTQYVKAGHADWAIINKETKRALGIFNPHGHPAALKRVAIRTAKEHNLKFTHVELIPVGLMSPEYRETTGVAACAILIDDELEARLKKKGK